MVSSTTCMCTHECVTNVLQCIASYTRDATPPPITSDLGLGYSHGEHGRTGVCSWLFLVFLVPASHDDGGQGVEKKLPTAISASHLISCVPLIILVPLNGDGDQSMFILPQPSLIAALEWHSPIALYRNFCISRGCDLTPSRGSAHKDRFPVPAV